MYVQVGNLDDLYHFILKEQSSGASASVYAVEDFPTVRHVAQLLEAEPSVSHN